MDMIYLGIVGLFFAGTWGLVRLCSSLGGGR